MRPSLTFTHNPFAGVVCDNCGGASNPTKGINRGLFTGHRLKKHNDGNHDLDAGLQLDKVVTQGNTLAELHHSLPQDSDRFDLYMEFWSKDFHTVFWCNDPTCNIGYMKKDSHRRCSVELVPTNVRRLVGVKHSNVFLRETHQTLVEMERLFSISYRDTLASSHIQATAAANIGLVAQPAAALNAALRDPQAESAEQAHVLLAAEDTTTSADTSCFAHCRPSVPFARLVVPECVANMGDKLFTLSPGDRCLKRDDSDHDSDHCYGCKNLFGKRKR
jgi:hypothetical protein